jgi:hypothetical protein
VLPDDLVGHLSTPQAGRFLNLSSRTLEKHRTFGTGPVYRKIGGRVVYTVEDLKAWSERGARRSTTDPHASVVPAAKPITANSQPSTHDRGPFSDEH